MFLQLQYIDKNKKKVSSHKNYEHLYIHTNRALKSWFFSLFYFQPIRFVISPSRQLYEPSIVPHRTTRRIETNKNYTDLKATDKFLIQRIEYNTLHSIIPIKMP